MIEQITEASIEQSAASDAASVTTEAVAQILSVPEQYLPVLIFFGIAIALSSVVILIPFLLRKMRPDAEKNSPYECGFEAEGMVRNKFDVQFYLVAILFIVFDLEVAFLFPWAVSLGKIGVFGFWSMMIFLIVLTIGFVYEWKRGALEWK
jgi:NADH-quinone oxidoreductase subunit A